ncbi:MAG: hypothetical protein RLZZ324_942 [Candidatus Parcubacteria bacterium]
MNGSDPHVVEDYVQGSGTGQGWRATHRTAIALPAPITQKMSQDNAFADEIVRYCATRRTALEKTTVVYDPSHEHAVERLFPKWLFTRREGGQSRESIACVPVPFDILALMKEAPANFTSSERWREWVGAMPAIDAADPRTDVVPPRITALVLSSPQYFMTPDYRSWIGRTKQRKREEIITREIAAMFAEASGNAPEAQTEKAA